MRNDPDRQDPKALWQNQPAETSKVTMALIRTKARDLRGRTRKQLLGAAAGPLTALFLYIFAIAGLPPLQQGLHLFFASAVAWSVAGLYVVNRGMWPRVMPGDAGLSTGLEFCRHEVARRRLVLRRVLLWSFAPILLAIATFIVALALVAGNQATFRRALPFCVAVFLWIIGYCVIRFREQRGLDRELDELNQIERDNPVRNEENS